MFKNKCKYMSHKNNYEPSKRQKPYGFVDFDYKPKRKGSARYSEELDEQGNPVLQSPRRTHKTPREYGFYLRPVRLSSEYKQVLRECFEEYEAGRIRDILRQLQQLREGKKLETPGKEDENFKKMFQPLLDEIENKLEGLSKVDNFEEYLQLFADSVAYICKSIINNKRAEEMFDLSFVRSRLIYFLNKELFSKQDFSDEKKNDILDVLYSYDTKEEMVAFVREVARRFGVDESKLSV